MLASAKRKVILADHSKFGDDHFAQFGNISDLDVIITDSGIEKRFVDDIEALEVKVVCA
jgi:DeoR family fructose operon transcriptional repressor